MTQPDLSGLERIISRVLRTGVTASTACFAAGLALWIARLPFAVQMLDAGIIVLMAVPVTRILMSFVDAVHRRDRLLGWATAVVLVVLVLTTAYSLGAQP
jgi:Protein of unknown function (DUF1634).